MVAVTWVKITAWLFNSSYTVFPEVSEPAAALPRLEGKEDSKATGPGVGPQSLCDVWKRASPFFGVFPSGTPDLGVLQTYFRWCPGNPFLAARGEDAAQFSCGLGSMSRRRPRLGARRSVPSLPVKSPGPDTMQAQIPRPRQSVR